MRHSSPYSPIEQAASLERTAPQDEPSSAWSERAYEQPLVFLRRMHHVQGLWPNPPRQRVIRTCAILYIRRGAGELIINHAAYRIGENRLFLLLPGMRVIERADPRTDWDAHYVAFKLMRPSRQPSGGWSIQEFGPAQLPDSGALRVSDLPRVERLFAQLEEDGEEAGGWLRWKRQLALAELLYTLIQEQQHATLALRSQADTMRHYAAYMDQHYAENIRMDKMAQLCGLNPSTFSRLFKQTIGMTPSDYVMQARMEAAKTMLRHSGRMRDVAQQVGFCDEYYFSRMFKKVVGVAPSVYSRTARAQAPAQTASGGGIGSRGRMLEPSDVAVTYVDEADHLIALGLMPAAVPGDHELDSTVTAIPYLKPYIQQLPRIGCERTIDMELLRKLQPQLIIAGRFLREWGITGLDAIARTHYYAWEVDWRNVHWELAALLGREAQAERNIFQFNRLVRSVRDRMYRACLGATFVFLETTREGIRVSPYMSNGSWLLFQQLGLTPSPVVTVNEWSHFVTPEEAAALPATYLFVGRRSGSQAAYEAMMNHPDVQRIRRKLIEVPRYPWGKGGPLAFSQGVKDVLAMFERIHK